MKGGNWRRRDVNKLMTYHSKKEIHTSKWKRKIMRFLIVIAKFYQIRMTKIDMSGK